MKLDKFMPHPLAELDAGDVLEAFAPELRSADIVSRGRIVAKQIGPGPLLRASHHLRYQTYCIEKDFLCADDYADQLERDEYDAISTHFGVFLDEINPNRMIATARLVPGERRFPLHDHCVISSQYKGWFTSGVRAAEISRLMISKAAIANFAGRESYALRKDILVALYKAIYHWVESQDISLLFAAMEISLARLLRKTGFPFLEIGPEADYYGTVFPYLLDVEFAKLHLRMYAPEIGRFILDERFAKASQPAAGRMRPLAQVA